MAQATSKKSKSKLSKKELKQDRLVALTAQIEHFYHTHRNLVVGITGAVVIAILAVVFIQKSMQSARLEESFGLMLPKMSYGSGNYQEAKTGFESVLTKYSGDVAGEAQYFLGRIAFEQGDYPAAEVAFQLYLDKYSVDKYMDCAALAGLAAAKEAQGGLEEAAQSFEDIANKFADLPYAPQALYEAQRIYLKLNQEDKAAEVLKTLIKRYPDSALRTQARRDLDRLQ